LRQPYPRRTRARLAVMAMLIATVAVQAGGPAVAAPAPGVSYVALGDSYTAAPLVQPLDPAAPPGCLRSAANYPHLLAAWYRTSSFTDASCTGAKTDDFFAPQAIHGGSNPPQLDAVASTTQYVTVQVGGNDIGFAEIATNCITLLPLGTPCQNRYNPGGVDQISARIEQARPKVDAVLKAIKARAPAAKVFQVGYPSILPENGFGCWPTMPYAPADVPYLVAKTKELNAMVAQVAAANGVTFVDTYTPSLGHDACSLPLRRWIEPVIPVAPAYPVHPNLAGEVGMGIAVAAAVNAS
jgi:lysophospholipase L1-like esterase